MFLFLIMNILKFSISNFHISAIMSIVLPYTEKKTYIDNRLNIVHKINAFSEQYYINCLQTAWRWLYWNIKTMSFFFIQSYNLFWYRQIVGFHILYHVGVFFTIPVFFFHRWIVQSKSNQRIARTERVCPRDLCCAHARKSVWKKKKKYKIFFCMSVYCSYSEFFFFK